MRGGKNISIPIAPHEYDEVNERTTRRTIEQTFESMHFDLVANRNMATTPASLAVRRLQFLLMGA